MEKALSLFESACENGHNSACYYRGEIIYQGYDSVPADEETGLVLLRASCADDLEWSCDWLDKRELAHQAPEQNEDECPGEDNCAAVKID